MPSVAIERASSTLHRDGIAAGQPKRDAGEGYIVLAGQQRAGRIEAETLPDFQHHRLRIERRRVRRIAARAQDAGRRFREIQRHRAGCQRDGGLHGRRHRIEPEARPDVGQAQQGFGVNGVSDDRDGGRQGVARFG